MCNQSLLEIRLKLKLGMDHLLTLRCAPAVASEPVTQMRGPGRCAEYAARSAPMLVSPWIDVDLVCCGATASGQVSRPHHRDGDAGKGRTRPGRTKGGS